MAIHDMNKNMMAHTHQFIWLTYHHEITKMNSAGHDCQKTQNHKSASMKADLRLELQLGTFWGKIKMPHNVCWGNVWHGFQMLLHFLGYHLKPGYFWPTTPLPLPKLAICSQTQPKFGLKSGNELCSKMVTLTLNFTI